MDTTADDAMGRRLDESDGLVGAAKLVRAVAVSGG
jgi:hypothetical protein